MIGFFYNIEGRSFHGREKKHEPRHEFRTQLGKM